MPKFDNTPSNGHHIQGFSSESFIDTNEVLDEFEIKGNETIMDLGCGDGHLAYDALKRLNKEGNVIAVDMYKPSIEDIEKDIKKEKIENLTAIYGDITQGINVKDESVDIVILINVYHHINISKMVKEAITEMKRILKPNGKICIMEYKKQKVKKGGPKFPMRVHQNTVIESFENEGFKVEKLDTEVGEDIPEGKSHYLIIFKK